MSYNLPVSFAPSSALGVEREPSGPRWALAGFLLSGFLLALLGAILPAWGYHRDPPEFAVVGNYFLCVALGVAAAAAPARRIMARRGVAFLLTFSSGLACAALLYLASLSPAASAWWRALGLLSLGMGAGLLNMALFHAISRRYQFDAAVTANIGGVWYGGGCLLATMLVGGTFYAYSVPVILALMALVPGAFAGLYARASYPPGSAGAEPTLRQALADFRSPGAVMFALLLFFQFGNEWSLAGWLPIYLVRRVGLSPKAAVWTLALYWLFLLTGRLGSVAILPRVRHGRLLLGSVVSALFGCLILASTKTGFGAASGVFFVGAGYASMFPLVAEAIGRRFPYYHPGFFNSIFSLALMGGMLAPASLGYAAAVWGVGVVIGIPLLGTCMVMLLILLIWLESKVTGR
jgi:hypothetical protein